MSVYYYLQSPYLQREMAMAIQNETRMNAIRSYETKQTPLAQRPIGLLPLHPLKRADSFCQIFLDERGRPALSNSTARAVSVRPLWIYWTDGAKRTLPLNFLKSFHSSNSSRYPLLCSFIGGSSALLSRQLDDKTAFMKLTQGNDKLQKYIPQTIAININDDQWRDQYRSFLYSLSCASIILKPSAGLKQRGVVVFACDHGDGGAASVEKANKHMQSVTKPGKSDLYLDWVVQEYVDDVLCLSGLDIGLIKGEENIPVENNNEINNTSSSSSPGLLSPSAKTASSSSSSASPIKDKGQKSSIFSDRLNHSYGPAKAWSKPTKSSAGSLDDSNEESPSTAPRPRIRCVDGELPSDSGAPVQIYGMYKIHFRIFAMVTYSAATATYIPYLCRAVKVYHGVQPQYIIPHSPTTGSAPSPSPSPWLRQRPHNEPPILKQGVDSGQLTDVREPLNEGQSISKYLAFRLANDIFSPAFLHRLFATAGPAIAHSVEAAVDAGSMGAHEWAANAFQILGYDFLWDQRRGWPVLLEVNNNVGQGLMKAPVMEPQGMSHTRYNKMCQYWTEQYREPFCEHALRAAVDPHLYGRANDVDVSGPLAGRLGAPSEAADLEKGDWFVPLAKIKGKDKQEQKQQTAA